MILKWSAISFKIPDNVPTFSGVWLGMVTWWVRITSYNVCYTKLLRFNISLNTFLELGTPEGICRTVIGSGVPTGVSGAWDARLWF